RALLDLLADTRPVSFGIVGHAFFIIAIPKNIRNPSTQMASLRCLVCEVPMTQSWYVGAAALVVKHPPVSRVGHPRRTARTPWPRNSFVALARADEVIE